MENKKRIAFYFLLVSCCAFGVDLVDAHVFHNELSGISLGLAVAVVFITTYPLWVRIRTSAWKHTGRWSFVNWVLLGVLAGGLIAMIDAASWAVTRYYSQ